MALIKCSECGKEFSDKAASCPNCGCPVSEVIKGNTTPEEQKKAAEQIFAAVERTLDRARKAGARFELESVFTKELAEGLDCNPNWKHGKENIRLIVSDAVKTCDALYSTYQGLIPKLDTECRPLLQKNPGSVAIRFVLGTIQWLNDESEIENNYAAHYEDINLGTLVRAKYLPSEANKMIQGIWQAEYLKSPDAQADNNWSKKLSEHKHLAYELERTSIRTKEYPDLAERRAEQKEAEEEWKKAEEEREKAEELKLKAKEKQRRTEAKKRRPQLEADKKKYEAALQKWESECESIKAKHSDYVNEKIAAEKISLAAAAEKRRDNAVSAANAKIASETNRKQEAEAKLASLGAFKFSEKKTQKRIIEDATRLIAEAQAAIPAAQTAFSREIEKVEDITNDKRVFFQKNAEREYPLPDKPQKPQSMIKEEQILKAEEAQRKQDEFNRKLRKAQNSRDWTYEYQEIIDYLMDSELRTATEIKEELFAEDIPPYKISLWLRKLEDKGLVVRKEIKRRTHFKIAR